MHAPTPSFCSLDTQHEAEHTQGIGSACPKLIITSTWKKKSPKIGQILIKEQKWEIFIFSLRDTKKVELAII